MIYSTRTKFLNSKWILEKHSPLFQGDAGYSRIIPAMLHNCIIKSPVLVEEIRSKNV